MGKSITMKSVAVAATTTALLWGSAFCADPADARMFHAPTKNIATSQLRVTNVEPDNGTRLMWTLSNGASYVTKSRKACKKENRPRLCRKAYRIAERRF